MYKYIAIDANNLYWRSVCTCLQNAIEVPIDDDKVEIYSSVIRDFLDRYWDLKGKYLMTGGNMYLLFDNPTSTLNLRKIIDEEYKSPRMNKILPKAFWDTLKVLKELLRNYDDNLYLMYSSNCEADDLVRPLIDNTELDSYNRMLLVSADMDWARGIQENIDWFNYHTVYNMKVFFEKYNFNPSKDSIILYKVFRGDASDNIEVGVPNIPEKLLLEIIKKSNMHDHVNFVRYIHSLQLTDYIPNQWKLKIKENEERIIKNYYLVDFIDLQDDYKNIVYSCFESLSILKSFFRILHMTEETRMLDGSAAGFFAKKKYKRIRS